MTTAAPRVMFVHAHPDDETITTGGSIAALAAAGAAVRVVTCTLGEEGEVLGEEFSGLVAEHADQLGGYRIAELRAALRVLGVDRPRFLGGAGRWRDSGMAGTPAAEHPRAFVNSGDEAVTALVTEIEDFRPDLVVTYDPSGGYGHPDHIRAHRITHEAVKRAAHRPRRLAWTVSSTEDVARLHPEPPPGLRSARPGELPGYPPEQITHRIRLDDAALSAKVAALGEHATQLEVVGTGYGSQWFFALTNHVLQPVAETECYLAFDLDGSAGPQALAPGDADLLAGLASTGTGAGTRR